MFGVKSNDVALAKLIFAYESLQTDVEFLREARHKIVATVERRIVAKNRQRKGPALGFQYLSNTGREIPVEAALRATLWRESLDRQRKLFSQLFAFAYLGDTKEAWAFLTDPDAATLAVVAQHPTLDRKLRCDIDIDAPLIIADLDTDMQHLFRRDWEGGTALHVAVARGHVTFAEMLLVMGADVNAANWRCQTPLDIAACLPGYSSRYSMPGVPDARRVPLHWRARWAAGDFGPPCRVGTGAFPRLGEFHYVSPVYTTIVAAGGIHLYSLRPAQGAGNATEAGEVVLAQQARLPVELCKTEEYGFLANNQNGQYGASGGRQHRASEFPRYFDLASSRCVETPENADCLKAPSDELRAIVQDTLRGHMRTVHDLGAGQAAHAVPFPDLTGMTPAAASMALALRELGRELPQPPPGARDDLITFPVLRIDTDEDNYWSDCERHWTRATEGPCTVSLPRCHLDADWYDVRWYISLAVKNSPPYDQPPWEFMSSRDLHVVPQDTATRTSSCTVVLALNIGCPVRIVFHFDADAVKFTALFKERCTDLATLLASDSEEEMAFDAAPSGGFGFGAAPSAASTAAPLFGAASTAAAPAPGFGGSSALSFGAQPSAAALAAATPFGFGPAALGSGFGAPPAASSAFGGAPAVTPAAPAFGGGSAFGAVSMAAPAPAFGGSSAFGAQPSAAAAAPPFGAAPAFGGGSAFGAAPAASAAPVFGGGSAFGAAPACGNSAFGAAPAAPAFGGGSAFGGGGSSAFPPAAAPGFSGFSGGSTPVGTGGASGAMPLGATGQRKKAVKHRGHGAGRGH